MIYLLSTNEITPGKIAEFQDIVARELVPLYPKVGMKLVASWHSYTGNVNEAIALYAFNDMAEFQKSMEMQRQNSDYQRVSAKMNTLRVSQARTILEPNAWSPMK
jgi:hypothetical protein